MIVDIELTLQEAMKTHASYDTVQETAYRVLYILSHIPITRGQLSRHEALI
jgi:hypothetical protein